MADSSSSDQQTPPPPPAPTGLKDGDTIPIQAQLRLPVIKLGLEEERNHTTTSVDPEVADLRAQLAKAQGRLEEQMKSPPPAQAPVVVQTPLPARESRNDLWIVLAVIALLLVGLLGLGLVLKGNNPSYPPPAAPAPQVNYYVQQPGVSAEQAAKYDKQIREADNKK